uniref:Reverse transcriptase Ty1/copia-type domain-containing protein n=1 Tax=Fagus sylvatica TaxID=28930 RepID=A0A2N9FV76_FAGSY
MPTSSTIITPLSTPHNNDHSPAPITSFSDPISPHSAPIPLSNDHVSDSTSSTSSLSPQSTSPTLTVPVSASVSPSIPAHMSDSMSTLLPVTHSSSGNTHPMTTRSKASISKKKQGFVAHSKSTLDYLNIEPPSYSVACKYSQWRDAMASEFQALQRQSTWTLVPSSPHFHVIGCHWVFKIKRHPDGSVARYKARLVAKGNHQQAGIDYDETFSPVVKPATVRLVLSLAAQNKWSLRQLDVSNAFLHGALKERVYMRQPVGFIDPQFPSHICSLQKSLYGLRQAPRAWFEKFSTHFLSLGFTASQSDSSLFIFRQGPTVLYLLLYVDDIILTGSHQDAITELVAALASVFELKDLGRLTYFLGLQIDYQSNGFFVHQTKYALDILTRHNMSTTKPCSTPFVSSSRDSSSDSTPLSDPYIFRSLVGALQYLTFTRPDLSYAVNSLCQHMHRPSVAHLVAAKRVLRYVRGTISCGILFQPGPMSLTAFTDADWAGNPVDRRSTTAFLVFLGNNLITWSSKKQSTVARSSTEAEYRSLAVGAAELAWLRMLLCDFGIFLNSPPIIWCDNLSAISLASNPVFHARTKHVEIDYHFVRERVIRGDLKVHYIPTEDQLADLLTKALPSPRFLLLSNKLLHSSRLHAFEGG